MGSLMMMTPREVAAAGYRRSTDLWNLTGGIQKLRIFLAEGRFAECDDRLCTIDDIGADSLRLGRVQGVVETRHALFRIRTPDHDAIPDGMRICSAVHQIDDGAGGADTRTVAHRAVLVEEIVTELRLFRRVLHVRWRGEQPKTC